MGKKIWPGTWSGQLSRGTGAAMSDYAPSLEILEVAYEVSPGGVRTFEVYDKLDKDEILDLPIYETESLTDAVEYCYNLNKDFIVRTYAEWEMREMLADL
jgi:hypothetical protein